MGRPADAGMRGVVSGPSGSGRGPNLKAPPPSGILKKGRRPDAGLKKSPVTSDNRPTFASRPVVVDPYADGVDPSTRFSSPSRTDAPSPTSASRRGDVELLGSPPRREARRRAEKPQVKALTTPWDGGLTSDAVGEKRRRKTPVKARPGTPAAVGASRRTPSPRTRRASAGVQ